VKTGNWLHHLQYDWENPVWRHVLRGLAEDHTLIRYDARGNGMSDWDVDDLTLDAWLSDLETVVEAVGVTRFPLLGISQGCAFSIAYAVKHPERVAHLILYGGYARGAKRRPPEDRDKRNAMLTWARLEWGADNPAFRQLFTGNFIPDATPAQADFFNELQRRTTSPECAARYMDVAGEFDITSLLPKVLARTLVMHVYGDLMVPYSEGKALASGIPRARLVGMQGRNHFFLEDEPASARFFEELKIFLQTE
jgi:pimeloyl-ACP methyl ester carboxylesterase